MISSSASPSFAASRSAIRGMRSRDRNGEVRGSPESESTKTIPDESDELLLSCAYSSTCFHFVSCLIVLEKTLLSRLTSAVGDRPTDYASVPLFRSDALGRLLGTRWNFDILDSQGERHCRYFIKFKHRQRRWREKQECARLPRGAPRRMSPEVPETVKEPLLAIETLQGHEGADPWRAGARARATRLVFQLAAKIARAERTREKEKSQRNRSRRRVPHNNSRKIFSSLILYLLLCISIYIYIYIYI